LRAVGGNIDPYWNIFTIHQKQDVFDILEQYFIGKIDPRDLADGKPPAGEIEDPFARDPERDATLIIRSARPCNAETPTQELGSYITPNNIFYVRNHLWVPEVADPKSHSIKVELIDGEEIEYSLEDLRKNFKPLTITATLQCSGNRRAHMSRGSGRQTNGLPWEVGAIGTAEWTGVRLRDVLSDAGVPVDEVPDNETKHCQFMGAEAYGASIPIEKAVDRRGDVILAYEMNGQPLPRDHGFPLRVIVPGHVAARSVKWVNKISVSDEESTSQWQRRDYKCFGPNEGRNPDWESAVSIQEIPVQSAITSIKRVPEDRLNDSKLARVYGLEEESVVVEGYAFAGGGRKIVRVDISPDNGRNWQQAEILEQEERGHKAWSWKQWRIAFPTRDVRQYFLVKAVDDSYNTQPDGYDAHYNFRGNLTSGWHRVPASGSDLIAEAK
jgi:sulfite oxidase